MDRVELHILDKQSHDAISNKNYSFTFDKRMGNISDNWREESKVEAGGMHLTFNLNSKGIQTNQYFREAIHLAVNRKGLLTLGAKRFTTSCSFYHNHKDTKYENSYDLKKARDLIQKSGYTGEKVRLYTYEKFHIRQDIEWVTKQCEQIGINIDARIYPINEIFKKETLIDAQIILYAETFDENANFNMIQLLQNESSVISSFLPIHLKQWVHKAITDISNEPCINKQSLIMKTIEDEIRNQFIVIYLYHYKQSAYYDKKFRDVTLNSLGWVDFRKLWVSIQ